MEPASDDRGVYLLSEPGHLLWFRDTVNNVSADIDAKLTKDIDLSEGGGKPSEWIPVGQYTDKTPNGYAGSFDGGGFTVSGYIVAGVVSMDDRGGLAAGFFGLAGQSAEIRGLTVSGVVSVDIGGNNNDIYAGGIVGINSGTITNCVHSRGTVSAFGYGNSDSCAGGIAGYNYGTITDCANSGGVSASGSECNYAGGIAGFNYNDNYDNDKYGKITNCVHSSGDVSASGSSDNYAGGIAGYNWNGTITNNTHSGGDVSAPGGSYSYAGGIVGYNNGKITNNANSGGTVTASGGNTNNAGGIAGYNDGTITNSCWLASGDLEAIGGGIAVSADVVSLDAAEMERVVTTVLPAKRTLSVEVGGSAPALISYPGTADDMAGYLSVSGDIFIASPDIADISRGWPCAVSGIKPGVTAVSFDIDLRGTDFSDKNNLKPLAAGCVTGPLSFTAAVGKVPVSGVSLDVTELTLNIGESKKLTATVKPDNATDKTVTWTSANPAVAAVDENGKVTALSAGTTVVTAKAGGVSAACTVTVVRKKTGGSSHGCAAGLGALPILTLMPLWLRRKKR